MATIKPFDAIALGLLAGGVASLAVCIPAYIKLWKQFRIYVRPVGPMYYRVAGGVTRVRIKR